MSTEPRIRPPAPTFDDIAHSDSSGTETDSTPAKGGKQSQATGDAPEPVAIDGQYERRRRGFASPRRRRLGPVEYTLLALILLGVAITTVMAIVNP